MSIGKNCIVIGNLVDEIPDNQIVIDMNYLDLSTGPALLGNDKGESPSVLIIPVGEGQIQKAIQMLQDVAQNTVPPPLSSRGFPKSLPYEVRAGGTP